MTTRAADDFSAIRARMAELRRPPVVPGSEPAPDAVFDPRNCQMAPYPCADCDRCSALGYCAPF